MNEESITQYINDTFEGIYSVRAMGAVFFSCDPEIKFPFATIVTNDEHDQASNLNRSSVFRLNIGISKATYRSLFGSQPSSDSRDVASERGYDFTALDQLMPHPVYGKMYWVCILNPSVATFQSVVQPLLAEAYNLDVSKHAKGTVRQ